MQDEWDAAHTKLHLQREVGPYELLIRCRFVAALHRLEIQDARL